MQFAIGCLKEGHYRTVDHGSLSTWEPANRNVANLDERFSIPKEDDVSAVERWRHGFRDYGHYWRRTVCEDRQ